MAIGIQGGFDDQEIVRSPRQASNIYDLDGASAPRHRNLFVVSFSKAGDASTGIAGSGWQKSLSFLAKSVDRPSVEPKVEEVKQYNKTRLIQTGIKYGPSRLTLYDTTDSMVMRMWAEYAKYYFGDFRHGASTTDWNSDVVQNQFNDSGGGFGFAPQAASNGVNDINAQFFFESMSIYQVYGNKFVQYKLLKPKITSFNPDELDYTSSEVPTITMTLSFEAIIYVNDFQPQPLSADSFLAEAFGASGALNGDVVDLPGIATTDPSIDQSRLAAMSSESVMSRAPTDPLRLLAQGQSSATIPTLQTYDSGLSSGGLTAYGRYNFGTTGGTGSLVGTGADGRGTTFIAPDGTRITQAPVTAYSQDFMAQSLAADLSQAALLNPALATALQIADRTGRVLRFSNVTPYGGPLRLSQAQYEMAAASVAASGGGGGFPTPGPMQDALTYGALVAAQATGSTPREMVYNNHLPHDPRVPYVQQSGTSYDASRTLVPPVTAENGDGSVRSAPVSPGQPTNSWNSASGRGLSLSPIAYGVVNAQRPSTSQIGFNERTTTGYANRFSPNSPNR